MPHALVSVVETATFIARAKDRMSDQEIADAITMVAKDPLCGVVMKGTGGLRKVRFALGGRGKSGGVRIVYAFHNEAYPIYLLTAERNALRKLVGTFFGGE